MGRIKMEGVMNVSEQVISDGMGEVNSPVFQHVSFSDVEFRPTSYHAAGKGIERVSPYMEMVNELLEDDAFIALIKVIISNVLLRTLSGPIDDNEKSHISDVLMINESSLGKFIAACYSVVVNREENVRRVNEINIHGSNSDRQAATYVNGGRQTYYTIGSFPALFNEVEGPYRPYDKFLDNMIRRPVNFKRIYPVIEFLMQIPVAFHLFELDRSFPEDEPNVEPEPIDEMEEYYNNTHQFMRGSFEDYNLLVLRLSDFVGY